MAVTVIKKTTFQQRKSELNIKTCVNVAIKETKHCFDRVLKYFLKGTKLNSKMALDVKMWKRHTHKTKIAVNNGSFDSTGLNVYTFNIFIC